MVSNYSERGLEDTDEHKDMAAKLDSIKAARAAELADEARITQLAAERIPVSGVGDLAAIKAEIRAEEAAADTFQVDSSEQAA
ncbi:MAG: hypothetical protein WCI47_00390 [bacterium]